MIKGFGLEGLGFRVEGSGFRVYGVGLTVCPETKTLSIQNKPGLRGHRKEISVGSGSIDVGACRL